MRRGYADPADRISSLGSLTITTEQAIDRRQCFTRLQRHAFAESSDANLPGIAMKQRLAKQIFKLFYRPSDGLRGSAQATGRLSKTGGFCGAAENTESLKSIVHKSF